MQIELFDPYPYRSLGRKLQSLLKGATRLDAAIAFVTDRGADFLRDFLTGNPKTPVRLIASVRFPTDLKTLARLESKIAPQLYIHTGFKFPHEKNADRGQFHSKVLLIEKDDNKRTIVLGSHNWTQNALEGFNLEASLIIHCDDDEQIVADVRRHIDECAARSEQFDPAKMKYYQAIQHDLDKWLRPAGLESQSFPGFEVTETLVIHAEDDTRGQLPDELQLFIPLRDKLTSDFFPAAGPVQLFVHPRGTLLRPKHPSSVAELYQGEITMRNAVGDAPVSTRSANSRINKLHRPVIDALSGNLPPTSNERFQVIARLNKQGECKLPIFHSAGKSPLVGFNVEYRDVNRDEIEVETQGSSAIQGWESDDESVIRRRQVMYQSPSHLVAKSVIRIPSRRLCPEDAETQLRYALHGARFVSAADEPDISLRNAADWRSLNDFVYSVTHQFTRESAERWQQQRRLFNDAD